MCASRSNALASNGGETMGLANALSATTAWAEQVHLAQVQGRREVRPRTRHMPCEGGRRRRPVGPSSEAAGLAKLQESLVKAEGRGDSIITGDEPGAVSATQSFVAGLGSILEKQLFCCQGGGSCLYASDFVDCSTQAWHARRAGHRV
jgi:hypothetical protein